MTFGPTAAHVLAVAHETLSSEVPPDTGRAGIGVTLQRLPFQLSANTVLRREPAVLRSPTARQKLAETQLIPVRVPPELPRMVGVRSAVQLLPFQRWAKPSWCPEAAGPTAMHHVGPMHDTFSRNPRCGLRMVSFRQRLPFQRSASGLFLTPPTARQN